MKHFTTLAATISLASPFVAAAQGASAQEASAQEAPAIAQGPRTSWPSGSRIRITSSVPGEKPVVGKLIRSTASAIEVALDGTEARAVPFADLATLRVSGGRKGHAWQGAVAGALTGLVYGVVRSRCRYPSCDEDYASLAGAVFGLGGATLGTFIGAGIKTERWRPMPIPAATTIGPGPAAISISFRF